MLLKKSSQQLSSGNIASAKVKANIFFKNSGAVTLDIYSLPNVKRILLALLHLKSRMQNLQCVSEENVSMARQFKL